jgi:simple sugar transport system ATP-binding protein
MLLISADLDEIWALSDRIAVIYEGRIVAVEDPERTSEIELGLLMAGGKSD